MRDLLSDYEEKGQIDELDKIGNPFTDIKEPSLIGEGYYRLEPLGYLLDNPFTVNLIGTNYENHGSLEVNLIPVDAEGNEDIADEDLPEAPEDLMDRRVDFLVNIAKASDLPSNFCKDVFVQYQIYLDDTKHNTDAIQGKNRSPEFNYRKQHTQPVVTENFLKFIKSECMVFKVYGFPDVKT